ncbi:pilus assembly protein [Pseudomonas sp. R2.Fl]|nr:pilus assembly protein [Pseudomonas sp. R2.Fl]
MRSRDGAAALEFAILAIPYFMVIFAIVETFVAFSAEQLLSNAVNDMARQMRTGQITYGLNRDTDKDRDEFRQLFCDEIAILMRCSETEVVKPKQLYLDVQTFTDFSNMPTDIPKVSNDDFADIDPTKFVYNPGGPKSVNMVRAFYRWKITADIIRPYITTIRPADGSMPTDFLIVATTAFQNEAYP